MTCTRPVQLPGLEVPCGKCAACRIHRTREWATRLIHELETNPVASFLTLTYSNENLPHGLQKPDLQLFFKRLRKQVEPRRIKYFACGEYGDIGGRPHYHAIIFGIGLNDPIFKIISRGKRGCKLEVDSWRKGFVYGGTVSFESARYVAGYVQKKLGGPAALVYGAMQRPFQLQSQGIGLAYAEKNLERLVKDLGLTVRGIPTSLPRYYRKKFADVITTEMMQAKAAEKDAELTQFLIMSGYDPVTERSGYLRRVRDMKEKEVNRRVQGWRPRIL